MAEILIRLSKQVDAAMPQLVLIAFARKLASVALVAAAFVFSRSKLSEHRVAVALARNYNYIQSQVDRAWAVAYIMLTLYVVYDCVSNLDDFLNCRSHPSPRPVGIFCAVSLACFVFTAKLSVSTLSIVVLMCARDVSTITGLACVLNFSVWANTRGSSVIMFVCCVLSGARYAFCGQSSNAVLLLSSLCWLGVWGWMAIVSRALLGPVRKSE